MRVQAMKSALPPPPARGAGNDSAAGGKDSVRLDMDNKHRSHILFSGTKLLRIEPCRPETAPAFIPPGFTDLVGERAVVVHVLRTGYHSSQVRTPMNNIMLFDSLRTPMNNIC
jgi:hypothetical protein